ncbi:MAG: hypothetical protein QF437_23505 [Planctomycetota bacterium]|jgi:hypothetical protein|nr:hypothetical protein [Planctomycetota bacterium]MDP7254903.1 hypothetical protein [Planctomycetota bacterium]
MFESLKVLDALSVRMNDRDAFNICGNDRLIRPALDENFVSYCGFEFFVRKDALFGLAEVRQRKESNGIHQEPSHEFSI